MGKIKRAIEFLSSTPLSEMPDRIKKRRASIERHKLKEDKMKKIADIEAQYGVDFCGYIPDVKEIGLIEGQCNGYEPSYDMPGIFGYLNIKEGDKLLDVGCGKGFAMYLFANFPFSRIDGVELSSELADIAEDNLKKLFPDEKERFHIYRENALEFNNLDEYNYIYMYNPFPPEVVGRFAEKLKESAKNGNRKLTVIYQNPQKGSLIEKGGVFKRALFMDGTVVFEST